MRLTLQADYALRTLLYLGLRAGAVVPVAEISDAYGISRHHLIKVAQLLGRHGYVDILRGKAGGLRLARAPEDVPLGQVVRRTEPSFDLVECFDRETNTCPITSACALKGVLYEARAAFLAVLDRYTLADTLRQPDVVLSLLSPERRRAARPAKAS